MNNIFLVNWLALVIGIVISFALGMFWYNPKVFFKKWQEAEGITDEQLKAMNPGKSMAAGLAANAVTVYALGILINLAHISTALGGALTGAFVAVFLITAAEINNGAFKATKAAAYLIDGGYRLVMMAIVGILFAVMR